MLSILIILIFILVLLNETFIALEAQYKSKGPQNLTVSQVDELDGLWLKNKTRVLDANSNDVSDPVKRIEPDWSLILGTYIHDRDENFAALLEAAGAPAFVRTMILSAKPNIDITKVPEDDYYYYEIEKDYPSALELQYQYLEEESTIYQVVVAASTWLSTYEERFRIGYTYTKTDFDREEAKVTWYFVKPNILVQEKVKPKYSSIIYREFTEDWLIVTVVETHLTIRAKRFYRRYKEETFEDTVHAVVEEATKVEASYY